MKQQAALDFGKGVTFQLVRNTFRGAWRTSTCQAGWSKKETQLEVRLSSKGQHTVRTAETTPQKTW